MKPAAEIMADRLREACCKPCAEGLPCKRVSADHPPKGDGGIEVQTEEVNPFVGRATRAIVEGKEEPPAPVQESKSPALARALAGLRSGLRNVSA